MSSFHRKVTKGVAWSAIDSWGSALVLFVTSVILARLLHPQAFGLVAMALVYVSVVNVFVEQGLGSALVQRAELEPEHLDSAFWISILAAVALATLSFAGADLIATLFREPALAPVVRWLSLNLIFSGLQGIQRAILERELAFNDLAKRSLLAAFVAGVVGVAAALSGFGVWSLVAQTLTNGLVGTLVLWNVSTWRPGLRFSGRHFRDLFGFSVHVLGNNLLNLVNRRSDDLLIGWFLGPVILGYYTVAYGLLKNLTNVLVGVVSRVAFTAFSRLQGDPEKVRSGFYTATRYTSLVAFPVFLGLMVVAPEFITSLYGPKWAPSIPVMRVLAMIGILHSVFYFNGAVILAAGKSSWRFWLTMVNAISNLIAFAVAVQWGIVAVAAAYVIRGYLFSPLPLWMVHRLIRIDLRTYLGQYIVPLIGSALMIGSIVLLRMALGDVLPGTVQLVIYVLTGAAVYAGVVYAQAPDLRRNLLQIRRRRDPRPVGADSRP